MKNKSIVRKKIVEVMKMVEEDMKNDATEFDGKPFNGRTVAEYFGSQGAAISAIARSVRTILENEK